MNMIITPSRLCGTLSAISSKSFVHRLLICAALADSQVSIRLNTLSDDINATIRCLEAMGATVEIGAENILVTPILLMRREQPKIDTVILDCGESGSTARFLLPLASLLFDSFTMTGSGRLPGRPFAPLCRALAHAGATFDSDTLPLSGGGKIHAGNFSIEGDVSSQFISGLLFTLPLLASESTITLATSLESAGYVDMTIDVLRMFGIKIERTGPEFRIPGNQRFSSPGEVQAEGDWSNAAFFLCMAALGGDVTVTGLSPDSTQGDAEIIDLLRRFGVHADSDSVQAGALAGISIDASQIPDLVPVIAVVAAAAEGETRIYNAQRLRLKESDRIQSTFNMLTAVGADAAITEDGLVIHGKKQLEGGSVDGSGDHRIVMAAVCAACVCKNPVIIRGCQAVNKSYPSFFEDFMALGGTADVI